MELGWELLSCAGAADPGDPGRKFVLQLLDSFTVTGPHGTHRCLALELLGPSLLHCQQSLPQGTRMHLCNVREVMGQVLRGLHYLHTKANMIHTDLKPENVLLVDARPVNLSQEVPGLQVKVADLGNACWTDRKFSETIGTLQFRAPEILLGADYGPPVDVWAAACLAFELATGDCLFEPWADPSGRYTRDQDHLAWMTDLLGPPPSALVRRGQWGR